MPSNLPPPEARTNAAQRCDGCGTIWAIQIYPLEGEAKAEIGALIDESIETGAGGLH